jgi:predicted ABC-class ATPase
LRAYDGQYFELDALFRRLERFEARRNAERTSAVTSLARRRDAELLELGGAFEAAWAHELAALIDMKRLKTPEAEALTRSARAATALIAAKIEAASATTLDGLKVKARAILWRRNGEPLETIDCGGGGEDAQLAAPAARAS